MAKKENKFSRIDLLILGLLSEKPMHGYEINKTVDSEEMRMWVDIPMTSIYVSLSKLEGRGLVGVTAEKELGKPERSVFHITNKGRQEFLSILSEALAAEQKEYIGYNIPLFFLNRLPQESAAEVLNRRREFLKNWLNSLGKVMSRGAEKESSSGLSLVLDHMRYVIEARIKWLDGIIAILTGKGEVHEYKPGALELARQRLMVFRGNLKDSALSDVIHMIGIGQRTGTLVLNKDHLTRSLYFERGRVMAGASYTIDGRVKGKEGAVRNQETKKSVLKEILKIFEWQEGQFLFEEGASENKMIPLDITNENLILAGSSSIEDWTVIRKIVPSAGIVFDRIESSELEGLDLSAEQRRILTLANGVRDVQTLAKMGNMSVFEASRALCALGNVGAVNTVSRDRTEAFRLFEYIAGQLSDYLKMMRVGTVSKIEGEFNRFSEKESMPFRIEKGVVSENIESGVTLPQLITYEKESLVEFVNIISHHMGRTSAAQAMGGIVNYLPSDLHELFLRYEFSTIFPLRSTKGD